MPVFLEHVTQPDPQDWIDLNKIYSEVLEQNPQPEQEVTATITQWLANDQGSDQQWLIAGKFNARLLTAMFARQVGDVIYLSHFAVRPLTQGRGVAHQLIHHIQKWASENNYQLIALDCPNEFSAALQKRGFNAHSQGLSFP